MNTSKTILGSCLCAALTAPAFAQNYCLSTARLQRSSERDQLTADLKRNMAVCRNIEDPRDRAECLFESIIEFAEGYVTVREVYDERRDLCDLLGPDRYDPEIDPDDFTTVIDNEYLPFPVGAEWVYESETDEGLETITVTVLEETREILGVECVSVRDVVELEGEPVEDTIDWYAQDKDGNVWYFGEISFSFDDGWVESIEGSWLSGVDGAKPGIVMFGDPGDEVGTTYRQEWLAGEAEDAATVLDDDATVMIEIGTYDECVRTRDFQPLAPGALEEKYYAPGIGFIYEVKLDSPETVELVSYSGL